jgi:thiol-disulfide isomerase/thioredoxin
VDARSPGDQQPPGGPAPSERPAERPAEWPARWPAGRVALLAAAVLVGVASVGTLAALGRSASHPSGDAVVVAGGPGADAAPPLRTYPSGTPVPATLDLPALRSRGRVDLAGFRGHPVLVNFWASTCAPCVREFPLLARVQAAHRANGLVVLGVLVNDPPAAGRAFAARHGGSWPIAVDQGQRTADAWGVFGLPSTFFIRRDGTLAASKLGELTPAVLAAALPRL